MKKFSIGVALALVFTAQSASAQAYYTTPTYSYGSCTQISRDLTVGSRGSDVLSLQRFILSRNYPGAGSWMLTSYFGSATRAGVINIQMDMRLPQTGILDAQTRAAIAQATCGGSYIQPTYVQPQPTYPNTPWYNYNNYTYGNNYNNNSNCSLVYSNCQCGWYTSGGQNYYNNCGQNQNSSLNITYLSPQSGAVGTVVTISGSGFSSTNNTVRFGNGILTGLNSYDGRSLSFTVPATLSGYGYSTVTPGIYNVSVTNSSGANSNTLPFTVNGISSGSNTNAPWITNVSSPSALSVNTTGTWMVSVNNPNSASYTSVSVNWGDPVYGAYLAAPQQVYSTGQQTVTFTHAYAQAGTYTVTFTVSNSYGSNTSSATITVGGNTNAPTISYVTPSTGNVGSQIQIVGTGFNGDNTVHFGNGGRMHVTSASGNYIYFTIPQYLSACDVQSNGSYCAQYQQLVTPGQYQIYITTNGVNSNSSTFTVQ